MIIFRTAAQQYDLMRLEMLSLSISYIYFAVCQQMFYYSVHSTFVCNVNCFNRMCQKLHSRTTNYQASLVFLQFTLYVFITFACLWSFSARHGGNRLCA